MIIVMGTATFGPGEIDRLMPQIEAQLTATRAEDGCELYAYSRDLLDPDTLLISERWRNQAALTAHSQLPPMAAFSAALGTAKMEGLIVKAWDAHGERVLMGG